MNVLRNDVTDIKTAITSAADRCHDTDFYYKRPTATTILEKFQCQIEFSALDMTCINYYNYTVVLIILLIIL